MIQVWAWDSRGEWSPAVVVIAFVAVHDLVGPVEGADEVVAGALGAVEGIDAGDAPPDLMVRILVPGDILVLPALTCRAALQPQQQPCQPLTNNESLDAVL